MSNNILEINKLKLDKNLDDQKGLISLYNKKPSEELKEIIVENNNNIHRINKDSENLKVLINDFEDTKEELNKLLSVQINSNTHPPEHEEGLLNPELMGGDYNGVNLLPHWIKKCVNDMDVDTSKLSEYLDTISEQSKIKDSSKIQKVKDSSKIQKVKEILLDKIGLKLGNPELEDKIKDLTDKEITDMINKICQNFGVSPPADVFVDPSIDTTKKTPPLIKTSEIITFEDFIKIKQNRGVEINIKYTDDLIKKIIPSENFQDIVNKYFDPSTRQSIIDEYGKLQYWNVIEVNDMSHSFKDKQINEKFDLWDVSNLLSSNNMFSNSVFSSEIGFDFRKKKVIITDIPSEKLEELIKLKDLKKDSNGNYFYLSWSVDNLKETYAMFAKSNFNGKIGNWEPKSLEDVSYMFSGTPFNQPIYFGSNKIKSMEYMFAYSKFDNYVHFSKNLFQTVENMKGMFFECRFFNKPISNKGNLLFINKDTKFKDKGSLKSLESMFQNATKFNQSFENIKLNSEKINFSNFLNGAVSFDKIDSLQNMSLLNYQKHNYTNSLVNIKKPEDIPNELFEKIKNTPKIFGINDGIKELIKKMKDLENKLLLYVGVFNFEINSLNVHINSTPLSDEKRPDKDTSDIAKKMNLSPSDTYDKYKNNIFIVNEIDFRNIKLKQSSSKEYTLSETKVKINQLEINKYFKEAFSALQVESIEPYYNCIFINAAKIIYEINNIQYIDNLNKEFNETNLFPKSTWETLLISSFMGTSRYESTVGWYDSNNIVKTIIDFDIVKSYSELVDCLIFYRIYRSKHYGVGLTIKDIVEKNKKLKTALEDKEDYLEIFKTYVDRAKEYFKISGFILGSYFDNINIPIAHIEKYNIEKVDINKIDKGGLLKAASIKKPSGDGNYSYKQIVNSIDNLVSQTEEYIYNVDCEYVNTLNFEKWKGKQHIKSYSPYIESTAPDGSKANDILKYIHTLKENYLKNCSNYFYKGIIFSTGSNDSSTIRNIIRRLGELHGTEFDMESLPSDLTKINFKNGDIIKSKNICKTYRYHNTSTGIRTPLSFSSSSKCCIIRYEVPVGTIGVIATHLLSYTYASKKNIFDLYKLSGENEFIFHPFFKFEITNIRYGKLDVTDSFLCINDEFKTSKSYQDKFIVHLKVIGLHDYKKLPQKETWNDGDIIKINFPVLQKNCCTTPLLLKLFTNPNLEDRLYYQIKKESDKKIGVTYLEDYYSGIFMKKNSDGTFSKGSIVDIWDTSLLSTTMNPVSNLWNDKTNLLNIRILKDDSCKNVTHSVSTLGKNKSHYNLAINADNFFTISGNGLSLTNLQSIVLPKNVWVLVPHWKGLEQGYEINSNITSSFESILYNLNNKDESFSSNVFSFNHGFKLYKDGTLPKDIQFSLSKAGISCTDLIQKGDERISEKLSKCTSGVCMIPVLSNVNGKLVHINKNNKNKYRFKVCRDTDNKLTDVISQVDTLTGENYDVKIVFPLSSNVGTDNITISPIPHNNLSWEEIFKILINSEDNSIKPDHPIFL